MGNVEIVRKKLNELAERSNEISKRESEERHKAINEEHLKEVNFEKKCREKWRNLGVLGLFEELRDSGELTMRTHQHQQERGFFRKKTMIVTSEPAVIRVSENSCEIDFNERWYDSGNSDTPRRTYSHVVARVDEQNRMVVNDVPVETSLEEAVAIAIAKEKGFKGV